MQVLHDLWYGKLYKTMAVNSWAEADAWQLPFISLVELGNVVEI